MSRRARSRSPQRRRHAAAPAPIGGFACTFGKHSLLSDGGGDAVLLVVAHPDDETMFFAPSILALSRMLQVHLLCLSTGDFDGLGATRAAELPHACEILGLPKERVAVLDVAQLRDGPANEWASDAVARHVRAYLQQHSIQRVLTFDAHGISGHPNHTAIHRGVQLLIDEMAMQQGGAFCVRAYALRTTWLLRRFSSWLDFLPAVLAVLVRLACCNLQAWAANRQSHPRVDRAPPVQHVRSKAAAYLSAPACCVSVQPWRCHLAMRAHASQYVWYRRIYMLFSRYIFVNTLEPMRDRGKGLD
jgi:N-acetylglucosaminylphosphatidylinositol deacetylase